MAWTVPRTCIPGELVTASMMNTHVRDNTNYLYTNHLQQSFRSLTMRSHPDADVAASKLLFSADEIIMDDGTRLPTWTNKVIDITVSGAGGLDTGAEGASRWYEAYAIAKDDGTLSGLLHRAKDYLLDQQQVTRDTGTFLRDAAAETKIGETFQVSQANKPLEFVDLLIQRGGSPSGRVWAEIQDNAGTILATSDKLDASVVASAAYQWVRFIFRTPVSNLATATTYRLALAGDFTISGANNLVWGRNTAAGYANGKPQLYDGATWTDLAGTTDFCFKIYLTENDVAVTMPTGYTKKCLIGHVYNDGGSNFIPFIQRDRWVRHIPSVGEQPGTILSAVPTLTDLSAYLPPLPVIVGLSGFSSTNSSALYASGVPDGYGAAGPNPGGFSSTGYQNAGGVNTAVAPLGVFPTAFQAAYFSCSAGNGFPYLTSYQW